MPEPLSQNALKNLEQTLSNLNLPKLELRPENCAECSQCKTIYVKRVLENGICPECQELHRKALIQTQKETLLKQKINRCFGTPFIRMDPVGKNLIPLTDPARFCFVESGFDNTDMQLVGELLYQYLQKNSCTFDNDGLAFLYSPMFWGRFDWSKIEERLSAKIVIFPNAGMGFDDNRHAWIMLAQAVSIRQQSSEGFTAITCLYSLKELSNRASDNEGLLMLLAAIKPPCKVLSTTKGTTS